MGKRLYGGWGGSNPPEQPKPTEEIKDSKTPPPSPVRRTNESQGMYGGPVDGASGGGAEVVDNINRASQAYAEQNRRSSPWEERSLDE